MKTLIYTCLVVLLVMGGWSAALAQSQTVVTGTVTDASSHAPIQGVSVLFRGGSGMSTGPDGSFRIETGNIKYKTVEFSYVGYKTITKSVTPGKEQTVNVELQQAGQLKDIVISTKRGKYRNKNNPAVELIRLVIDHKDQNRVTSYDFAQYDQYEKMEVALTKEPEKLLNSKIFKNYKFLFENRDTTLLEGKALLPVFLEETLSKTYFRKHPEKTKNYILGEKKMDYGEFVDNRGITQFLNRLYEKVDIYQNNIGMFTNQFLSPIADMAPTFYMFYLGDTTEVSGVKVVRLNFYPRNPEDLMFRGTIYVTLDGKYAVQKIDMSVSKHANLNWARSVRVRQDFEIGEDGRFHVSVSDMMAEFALSKSSAGGIFARRTVSYKNFVVNKPAADSVYEGPGTVNAETLESNSDSFWVAGRHQPLTNVESKVYANIDSLRNMKSYRRLSDWITLLMAGYKQIGPYFEMGPVNAFYSFNPVEGFRLRLGGRTTPRFNKSLYFETYAAYGFKDERWKYFLSATYALNHQSPYAYPLHYVQASVQHDTKIPGQELQFVQEDNFLLSFKRGTNDKWLYNDIYKLNYVREFGHGLSYTFGFKYWKQTTAGALSYQKEDAQGVTTIPSITTTELSGEFRWAPNEQFYQGKVYRIPIFNKYPIFQFRYIQGVKGLFNGQYSYENLNLSVYKRSYLGPLGYTDITLEGGYVFGKLPFPLLDIHRANQTYAYQLNAYNLMNFLEFVSDHYAGLNVDHYFNGFIFNKIPLMKKLQWREVITMKLLYGGVRSENNPYKNSEAFKFPTDTATGVPTTYMLNSGPYMEVSVGIMNIFKLLRIDYVERLTYLNNPQVSRWGIRGRLKFDF